MRFRILGPCEAYDPAGQPVPIRRRKARTVLALLLYGRNQVVSTPTLVGRLWGDQPPASAVANIQTYVSELRRALATAGLAGCLHTTGAGYLLQVSPGQVDADVFDELVAQGRQALRDGSPVVAGTQLGRAVSLWRGELGAGLSLPGPTHPELARLAARRRAAVTDWVDARLRLGQHQELAGELPALLREYPDHEPLRCHLMLAHYRCGQPGAAIRTYHELRTAPVRPGATLPVATLPAATLPGPAATELYKRILRRDPALSVPGGEDQPQVPRQLPAPPGRFAGRESTLRRLDQLLAVPDRGPVLIAGAPGVGKSALALHWAHRAAGQFPDGQLHADLHGHAEAPPAHPLAILRRFLADLGAGGPLPETVEEAASRFRTAVARRRLLILLDDAASPAQVRALLPGSPGCLVIVTSRDRLDGLVAREGAHRIRLGLLEPDEAADLLSQLREPGEPAGGVDPNLLAQRCGYLPLALRILGTHGGRADPLTCTDGERSVHAAFELSYRRLAEPEQRMFRLLGWLAEPCITPAMAAIIAASTELDAAGILDRLARVSLLEQSADGYHLASLLRTYAQRLSGTQAGLVGADATACPFFG